VVEKVFIQSPSLIKEPHELTREVFTRLMLEGKPDSYKWGLNGKRGNPNDLSEDCGAWLNPTVPWGCSIIDVIKGAGGDNPTPAWIDQTQATLDKGDIGIWVPIVTVEPEPIPDPVPNPDLLKELQKISNEIVLLGNQIDSMQDAIINHVTNQAQAVVHAVTSEANRVIINLPPPFKCRLDGFSLRSDEK